MFFVFPKAQQEKHFPKHMFVATHFKIVAIACMTNSESVYMNPTVFHTTASLCVISAPSLCQTHSHDDTAEISGSFIHIQPQLHNATLFCATSTQSVTPLLLWLCSFHWFSCPYTPYPALFPRFYFGFRDRS